MHRVNLEPIDPLRLFSKQEVAARAGYDPRTVTKHLADPSCPLRLRERKSARGKFCTGTELASYLNWLLSFEAA